MPYVITTKYRDRASIARALGNLPTVTRRAVATLEEARDAAYAIVGRAAGANIRDYPFFTAADEIPESGGTVGPLPDGTVIEVAPMDWFDIAETVRGERLVPADRAEQATMLAAYNEVQL